jgi:branched-chain amino acid transport system substrate-binding protein
MFEFTMWQSQALKLTRRTAVLILCCLYGTALCAEQRNVAIPIKAIGALSGPVKSFGVNSRAALAAASRRIDEEGGVRLADGSMGHFVIDYADDHCNPQDGITLLHKAAESDALALIGPSCSSVAEPLYGVLQHRVGDKEDHGVRIPVLTDGATKADLARISGWAFRNAPNEREMYQALWRWVREHRPELKTVYTGDEADFAHSHSTLQNIITKEAVANGLKLIGGSSWSIHETSFSTPADQIAGANADVVVVSAHAGTTCGILKALSKKSYRPKLLVGLTSASTPETLQLCGPEAEGMIIPTSFVPDTPQRRLEAEEVAHAGGLADLHSMSAWELLYTLKQVIQSGGIIPNASDIAGNRERLRAALAKLTSMRGVMGTITRTADRESLKPFVLVQATAGTWKPISTPSTDQTAQNRGEETFRVPFGSSGLSLFLRHRAASGRDEGVPHTVLFVHGASFPSALAAAFPFGGKSWMEDLSSHGFDTWALDFLGYGGSDRYPEMLRGDTQGPPLLRADEAAEQIATATKFILSRSRIERLSIVAHSWGTMPAGLFATKYAELLDRLVLFGPQSPRHGGVKDSEESRAWNVTVKAQMDRFRGYPPKGEEPVLDEADMPLWGEMYLDSDPHSRERTPPSVLVPSGPVADIQRAWAGEFPYEPEKIISPVLIIRGEWDNVARNDDVNWLSSRLVNAPIRRDVRIARGTHVMHLEKNRFQLYREVEAFLKGDDLP